MTVQKMAEKENWSGLAADSKPTPTHTGATFYEYDTRLNYVYDGGAWRGPAYIGVDEEVQNGI